MGVNLPSFKPQPPPVRGVLLDVFGTLFPSTHLRPAFAASGLDPNCAAYWLPLVFSTGMALTAAQDYRRFDDVALEMLVRLAPGPLRRAEARAVLAALQTLDPYPDVPAGLKLLRGAGLRVLTLAQVDATACAALFEHAGLHRLVDGFLSVNAVRRWKPAPEAYAYGVAQLGWPSRQVALISAHDWDIHGARRAGLQSGHILRHDAAPARIFDPADVAGPDLVAVAEKLLRTR